METTLLDQGIEMMLSQPGYKIVITSSISVLSLTNGGIISEQNGLTSLLPKQNLLSQDRYWNP